MPVPKINFTPYRIALNEKERTMDATRVWLTSSLRNQASAAFTQYSEYASNSFDLDRDVVEFVH